MASGENFSTNRIEFLADTKVFLTGGDNLLVQFFEAWLLICPDRRGEFGPPNCSRYPHLRRGAPPSAAFSAAANPFKLAIHGFNEQPGLD